MQTGAGANPVSAFSWPFFINTNGNVGIGTTSPGAKLDVKDGAVYLSDTDVAQSISTFWPATTHTAISPLSGTAGGSLITGLSDTDATAMAFQAIIGTAIPTVTTPAMIFASSKYSSSNGAQELASTETAFQFTNNSSKLMTILGGGNVGVGTTSPSTPLHVFSNSANVLVGNIGSGYGAIGFQSTLNVNNFVLTGSATETVLNTPSGTSLSLRVNNNPTNALVLNSAGNVGIGTPTPTTKLHVVGDVTVTGNIAAKYQDVAEWVPASSALPAGTVVSLDPAKSNHVEASSKPYDTRVAGVISEQPGITLGERGDNKVLVATTGRVRLKVDASNGPIQVGDLLVTSDIRGMAMKSKAIDVGGVEIHRPGTLIGKALEPLAKGRGEILVLLSLQ